MKQVHIIISGKVQGVYFRDNTCRVARELNLKGFVRNLPNGSVEVVAQGENIQELINFCSKGPPTSRVEKTEIKTETPTQEFNEFRIQ